MSILVPASLTLLLKHYFCSFLYSLFLLLSTFCSVGELQQRLQELQMKRQKRREARSRGVPVHVATEEALQVCLSMSTSPLLSSGT